MGETSWGVGDEAGEVEGTVDRADVRAGLGEVAELAASELVVHFREEAEVIGLGGEYLREVVEGAVVLSGVDQIAY